MFRGSIYTLEGPSLRGLAQMRGPQLLGVLPRTGISAVDGVIVKIEDEIARVRAEVEAKVRAEAEKGARAAIPEIKNQVHAEARKAVMPLVIAAVVGGVFGGALMGALVARRISRRAR